MNLEWNGISWENLSSKLPERLPELAAAHAAVFHEWGDEVPGSHVVYGDVLNPYIERLLKERDTARLSRVLEYLELLAKHPDVRVQEVVAVSVVEMHMHSRAFRAAVKSLPAPTLQQFLRELDEFFKG